MKIGLLLSALISIAMAGAVASDIAYASDTDSRERSGGSELVAGNNCVTNKTAFVARDDLASITSTTFVMMAGTRRLVTTSAAGCVIVEFAGELTSSVTNDRPIIRAVAQGVATAEPAQVRAGYPSSAHNFELRAMTFIFASLPAGSYDFRIEWRSQSGNSLLAQARTLLVRYQ